MLEKISVDVPDGACGKWRVETFEIDEKKSKFSKIRSIATGGRESYIPSGTYKRLMCGTEVVMSNTPMEIRTNSRFMFLAEGHILINGLGLGMVLVEILKKDSVKSISIIEKNEEVLSLVAPTYQKDKRIKFVNTDALEYKAEKGIIFDYVWHDIWTYICSDNLPEMHKLHRKYGRRVGWQDSWCRAECLYRKKGGS